MRSKSFRIATWNIASNKNYDAIASRAAQLDIDICAMQEVSFDPMTDLVAMFGPVNRKSPEYSWHFMPARVPEQPGGGRFEYFGLGFLSRIPLYRTAAFQLGPNDTSQIVIAENQPRILQVVAPQLKKPIVIGNTHLAPTADWSLSEVRRAQAINIASILRSFAKQGVFVLCGDFNTGPSSSDLTELREVLPHVYSSAEATFIGEPTRPPIDFFCSSAALEVDVSVCSAEGLSDHNIVVATFQARV